MPDFEDITISSLLRHHPVGLSNTASLISIFSVAFPGVKFEAQDVMVTSE